MMVSFLGVSLAATLLKLSSSIDDTIWLTKLVSDAPPKHRTSIAGVYLGALTFVTLVAYGVYLVASEVFHQLAIDEHVMTISSSLLLMAFAMFYLRKAEQKEETAEPRVDTLSGKLRTAFVVSCIGSIDELLTYVTVLSTGEIQVLPLLVGTLVAGMLIILIVTRLSDVPSIIQVISRIPASYIIFALGCVTLLYSSFQLSTR